MKLKRLKKWVESKKGQAELNAAYEKTKKIVDELVESRKIDRETLCRPFTI